MYRVRTQLGLTDSYLNHLSKKRKTQGIVIAVLDSGVSRHPDLLGRVRAFHDFTGKRKGHALGEPYDDYGHGTHVCGILCGNGALSEGRYKGILPESELIVGKVLDEEGNGTAEDMIAGLEWILRQKDHFGIRLLNVSVGISGLKAGDKLNRMQELLEKMTSFGINVICSAGNQGPSSGSLSALGESPRVISVGCHDGIYFRGDPRRCENYCGRGKEKGVPRKPDVVAPGTRIMSCSASYLGNGRMRSPYEERSGTSMAAPIVTG